MPSVAIRRTTQEAVGGRFLQTDPIRYGDGPNIYAYVHGDPINASDPNGTDAWIVARPIDNLAGLAYHSFIVVGPSLNSPDSIRFSFGPSAGGGGLLVNLAGSGDKTDLDDASAIKDAMGNFASNVAVTKLDASDADVLARGQQLTLALGAKTADGQVKSGLYPQPYFVDPDIMGGSNSNSAAKFVGTGASNFVTDVKLAFDRFSQIGPVAVPGLGGGFGLYLSSLGWAGIPINVTNGPAALHGPDVSGVCSPSCTYTPPSSPPFQIPYVPDLTCANSAVYCE